MKENGMKREWLSDPTSFRTMLRKVVRRTWPIVAASGLAVGCSQSITILPNDYEAQARVDAGVEVVVPEKPVSPETTNLEIDRKLDLNNIGKENQLNQCPVEGCNDRTAPETKKGRYLQILAPIDPSPLSFEKCKQMCQSALRKVFRGGLTRTPK